MAYALGLKAIRRLCEEQNPLAWHRAKLSTQLFKAHEVEAFEWVRNHLSKHHVLPQLDTLAGAFPEVSSIETPEPVSYYVGQLEERYGYERINQANLDAQAILKNDQSAYMKSLEVLRAATNEILEQKYRTRILDVGKELSDLVVPAYNSTKDSLGVFGWPYMDEQTGGIMGGDVVSLVGRPAAGKTWLSLWMALQNWKKGNVMFASMEIMTLPIAQRIAAMYAGQPISQLKAGKFGNGFADKTYAKFLQSMKAVKNEEHKLYVIDGNLAASAEDIFQLAELLQCRMVVVDGAYLLRHKNPKLDRFVRAAENVELIKRFCSDADMASVCSWQFNRRASEKQKKGNGTETDLEDIGYSDAIGQISSVVLGMFQQEGVETIERRKIRCLKGRSGETGEFSIAWNFESMQFKQVQPMAAEDAQKPQVEWV